MPQALGADEFLRVTWHEGRRIVVFSHWDGDRCVAATPVQTDRLGELAEVVVAALASVTRGCDWPAPRPDELIATSHPARAIA